MHTDVGLLNLLMWTVVVSGQADLRGQTLQQDGARLVHIDPIRGADDAAQHLFMGRSPNLPELEAC